MEYREFASIVYHKNRCTREMQGYRSRMIIITARHSYASAVLGVVILSVCPSVSVCLSVCHTRVLWLIQRTYHYQRYFLYHILITGNMQSKMGFPSSHQLKSYIANKSCLKLSARCPVSGCWPSCLYWLQSHLVISVNLSFMQRWRWWWWWISLSWSYILTCSF